MVRSARQFDVWHRAEVVRMAPMDRHPNLIRSFTVLCTLGNDSDLLSCLGYIPSVLAESILDPRLKCVTERLPHGCNPQPPLGPPGRKRCLVLKASRCADRRSDDAVWEDRAGRRSLCHAAQFAQRTS
jgi:hypothetical protein